MLPQLGSFPMDSSSTPNSPVESCLPPDICLKTNDNTPSDGWNTQPERWPKHTNSLTMEVSEDPSCEVSEHSVNCNDLLQSSCVSSTRNDLEICSSARSLPDLCEGAGSVRQHSDDMPQISPSHNQAATPPVVEPSQDSFQSSSHEALGAIPKIFKSKYGGKSKTSTEKRSSSGAKAVSKPSISRTIEYSQVNNSLSKDLCIESVLDPKTNINVETCDKSSNKLALEINDTENTSEINTTEINEQDICEKTESRSPGDEDKDSKDTIERSVPLKEMRSENEEGCSSLMDEYLFYDSRPISLVACGVWDCDSGETHTDAASGVVLVRNNLHSASHPMFAKWPCKAFIPSHILVEVAFNSHGTSLGTVAVGVTLTRYY